MPLPSSGPIGVGAIYQELTGSAVEGATQVLKCFNGDYAPINPNSPTQPSASTPYSLGSFHGYDQNAAPPGLTLFFRSQDSQPFPQDSCYTQCLVPQWHNGADPLPTIGDTVYDDSSGTQPIQGSGNYWGMSEVEGNPAYSCFLTFKNSGNVIDVYFCGF
jgi:hypothetical protein